MDDQKIENQLNLALEATEEERKKSLVLETGYDPEEKTWELIVKYSGNLDTIVPDAIRVTRLINEYAILVVPESLIESLAQRPEIEYIEKPKRMFFCAGRREKGVLYDAGAAPAAFFKRAGYSGGSTGFRSGLPT